MHRRVQVAVVASLLLLVGAGVWASPDEAAAVTTRKVTLGVTADSYSSSFEPTTASGTKAHLRADPARTTYLKFSVPPLAQGERITGATLQLTARTSASGTVTVTRAASSNWTEATLTHDARPAASGTVLASVGQVANGAVIRFPVTPAVHPGTDVSFIVAKSAGPLAEFASRETGAGGPQLVLTIDKESDPTRTGPARGAWLGAAVQGGQPENFQAMEAMQQRPLASLRLYRTGPEPLVSGYFLEQLNAGKIIVVTWKASKKATYHWADITRGDFDGEIRGVCGELAALGTKGNRVFFGFHHEPDTKDDLFRGSFGDYARAYRHVHDVCVNQAKATNVRWIWIVTGFKGNWEKYGPADNDPSNGLYPGNDVVDWVGFDMYGFTGCKNTYLTTVKPSYDWFISNGYGAKPFAHTETGVTDDTCKPAWFRSIPAGVKALPNVKLVMYFNLRWVTSDGTVQNYLVDSTPAAKSAWLETVADPALRPPLP
ncbi:CBM96 family carbohydrate-binding protein [Archangium violaceum]|uniref:CBM96 family carbohydrate-binding protein n=1 Tax=Archangium violaceum TaxID=83451 RepID=UPI0036DD1485